LIALLFQSLLENSRAIEKNNLRKDFCSVEGLYCFNSFRSVT